MDRDGIRFPKDFYWGASTSAHQVEGGNKNSWSEWEKKNAVRLAEEAVERYAEQAKYTGVQPELEKFGKKPFEPNNYISGKASDHYNRYEEDFRLIKELNLNAFRFGIEWSRVEPEKDRFDQKEIDHYKRYLDLMIERDIEPFLTLWHWTFPLWIGEDGWSESEIEGRFCKYAEKIFTIFDHKVKYWITLNEPMVYASMSYYTGMWPPQQKSLFKTWNVVRKMERVHRSVYELGKSINKDFQIGIAQNCSYNHPDPDNIINRTITKGVRWIWNEMFLDSISKEQDFIGINNYGRNKLRYGKKNNDNEKVSDMGWELYPQSIGPLVEEIYKRYKKPIFITENGLADQGDLNRSWYIDEILKSLAVASKNGVDLKGYLHWSLLDNFEWDKGFWPRFDSLRLSTILIRERCVKAL